MEASRKDTAGLEISAQAVQPAMETGAIVIPWPERASMGDGVSPEVRALNAKASLELFGSQGQTLTDPENGEIIATPEEPIVGKIDTILRNRHYGNTKAKRLEKANAYTQDLLTLTGTDEDGGLELYEAKHKLDERERAVDRRANKRVELERLVGQTQEARMEYARRRVGRDRRTFHVNKNYRDAGVNEAKQQYDDIKQKQLRHETEMLLDTDLSKERLGNYAELKALDEFEKLAKVMSEQRLLATGRYRKGQLGGVVLDAAGKAELKPKLAVGRAADRFYSWWGQHADAKFFSKATVKKSVVMAAAGAVVGLPAAVAGSVLLGPVGGGAAGIFVAGKISKGVMAHHFSKRGKDIRVGEQLDREFQDSINHEFELAVSGRSNSTRVEALSDILDEQTAAEIRSNRVRALASMAIAAAGGVVGHAVGEHVFGWGSGNHQVVPPVEQHQSQAPHDRVTVLGQALSHLSVAEHPAPSGNSFPLFDHLHGAGHADHGGGHQGSGHSSVAHEGSNNHVGGHQPEVELQLSYSGDAPELEISDWMNSHGYAGNNAAALHQITQATLDHEGIDWNDTYDLPVGFKFGIPREALEALNKTS